MKILRKLLAAIKKRFSRKRSPRQLKRNKKTTRFRRQKSLSRRGLLRRRKPAKKSQKLKKSKIRRPRKRKKPQSIKQKPQKQIFRNVEVGEITHYFSKIKVCVIKITHGPIALKDRLEIKGHTSRFIQQVRSLQMENQDVAVGHKGQLVGLRVDKKCRVGDKVSKVIS